MLWQAFGRWGGVASPGAPGGGGSTITSLTAGAGAAATNASITPVNPAHAVGDTLLCIVVIRDNTATMACATSGWTAATGFTNPQFFNSGRIYLFMNECDSASESNPVITVASGSPSSVIGAVFRIQGRSFGASFDMGTRAFNASAADSIPFPNNSPTIEPGNAILAIGVKNNFGGLDDPLVISGVTAGLTWSELVNHNDTLGDRMCFAVNGALNNNGSSYTAGTGGNIPGYTASDTSGSAYLEINAS